MFAGVNYEVNIANAPGSRIENLTWPNGAPVNNYRANSQLLTPGEIFEADDMPTLRGDGRARRHRRRARADP